METNYKKIIVAVDGSEDSDKAFKKAIDIANRNNATLVLTHVVDVRTYATIVEYDKVLVSRAREYGQELLDNYEQLAKEENVANLKVLMKEGIPKVVISKEVVNEENADLIIVGARGLNAVERFLLGSVSENIVRQAECDVLIVR